MIIHRGVVTRVVPLSSHLVRVTLGGPGLAGFLSTGSGDEYVRMFFPHGEDPTDVVLPEPDGDWWKTPEGAPEAPMRTYTIRAARPESGEIDVDFVVHDDGVAGPWASRAQPGHVLGVNSPTALYELPADARWQFLAADLTGLPAIARIVEDATATVRTRVVVEVLSEEEADLIPQRPHVEVTAVIGGNGATPSRIGEIVRGEAPRSLPFDTGYVWVAGETAALRDARKYLHRELAIAPDRFKVVGYWNRPEPDRTTRRRRAVSARR
ncbi:siderophore-interacting protein [Microbacterium sp. TNHR37B]|uniref:siderophore-interacting protein n=1 Tax=Microbacterium sp. TNHR37B TaxID=1775956 RepID=UPI0007B25F52|nr:siderophore-interacting protein [Microbacterium sp. TNHR37B]KZE90559.1 Vibriobactin utilization protein ViuB [Microbacterium sp. TNHR37B]